MNGYACFIGNIKNDINISTIISKIQDIAATFDFPLIILRHITSN